MASIQVRYPGRACVLGEHCDWAGGSSLTIPLPLGIEVRAEPGRSEVVIKSQMDGEVFEGSWDTHAPRIELGALRFVPAAIRTLRRAGLSVPPAELWIQSDLPAGRGLSSSAAFSLGVLDALTRLSGQVQTPDQLVEMAYQLENRELSIDCGKLDPAACAAGQPLFLQWTRNTAGDTEMTARRVTPLQPLHFVIGAFDRPRNTKRILETLNQHHSGPVRDPDGDAVREAIAEFGFAAELGARAMSNGDIEGLGSAMNRAQNVYENNLARRFSSTRAPQLIQTVQRLRAAGALGAKFSGAGGDGSVLALYQTENEARSAAILLEEGEIQAWYARAEVQ